MDFPPSAPEHRFYSVDAKFNVTLRKILDKKKDKTFRMIKFISSLIAILAVGNLQARRSDRLYIPDTRLRASGE